jgi:uncharacterized protein (TIGR02466 family)
MNHKITPLFAVPLYQTNIGKDDNDTDFIKSQEFVRMPADNGSYTVNKRILDSAELKNLRNKIQSHIDNFTYEILDCDDQLCFEIQNSWVNQHGKNDFAGLHRHSNSIISGIYYLEVYDQSGAIVFQKDKSYYNLWTDTIEIGFNYQQHGDQDRLNVFNADAWGIYPQVGDLILFPSLLYHSVTENLSDDTRYSLAFNVFPKGVFGTTIDQLEIK